MHLLFVTKPVDIAERDSAARSFLSRKTRANCCLGTAMKRAGGAWLNGKCFFSRSPEPCAEQFFSPHFHLLCVSLKQWQKSNRVLKARRWQGHRVFLQQFCYMTHFSSAVPRKCNFFLHISICCVFLWSSAKSNRVLRPEGGRVIECFCNSSATWLIFLLPFPGKQSETITGCNRYVQ